MGTISTAREAEENAAVHMRKLGFPDAAVTDEGPDGGIDVRSSGAVAQVKLWFRPVGSPALQQLYGARGTARHEMLFFAHSGYSKPAVLYADQHSIALFTFDTDGNITAHNDSARALVKQRRRLATPPPAKRSPASLAPKREPGTSGRSVASILAEETAAAVRSKSQPRSQPAALILPSVKSSSPVLDTPATTIDGIPLQIRAEYGRAVAHMRFLQIGGGLEYRVRGSDMAIYSPTAIVWLITTRRLQMQDIHHLRELSGERVRWGVCFTTQPIPASTLNEAAQVGIALFRLFKDGSIDPENPPARTLVDAARRAHPLPPAPSQPKPDGHGGPSQPADSPADEGGFAPLPPVKGGLYQNKFFRRPR
ncbi:hypothetical protein E2561_00570 [Rhodococcus ruber]|nr:hypothetical protein E2561_00570 [Rhodococcus ruber]